MSISFIAQCLLTEWNACRGTRYPVLIVIPGEHRGFSPVVLEEFGKIIGGELYDCGMRYQDQLSQFKTRTDIRFDILSEARKQPVIVLNIEYFYDKWTGAERLAFLKDLSRLDGHHGIVMVIYCEEDLYSIKDIPANSRGVIWNPYPGIVERE